MNYKKYVAPAVEIITMQTEGMIAGSGSSNGGFTIGGGGFTIGGGGFTIGPGEGSMGAGEMTSFEVEEPASYELDK